MSIAEEKKEILSLIEQLYPKSGPKKAGLKPRSSAPIRPLDDRIAKRREELDNLKGGREKLGQDLLEERMLKICEMLDRRISRIEEMILAQRIEHREAPPPTRPKESPQNGIDIAENLSSMEPDMDMDTIVQEPHTAPANEQPPDPVVNEAAYSLTGSIQDGILPDILQMVSSNDKTGVFTVEEGDKKIDLFFNDGQICHASANEMEGQTAFFAAMALENGRFYFNETDQIPDENTIQGNTQFMILEALRQIDEEGYQE